MLKEKPMGWLVFIFYCDSRGKRTGKLISDKLHFRMNYLSFPCKAIDFNAPCKAHACTVHIIIN